MKIEAIEDRGAYISCNCAGQFNADEFIEILNQAIRHSIQKGIRACLINVSDVESAPLDTFQRFAIGERIAATQLNYAEEVKIAVVGREPLIESRKFAETVALNRGAKGKAFHDLQQAISWIGSEEES
jgi:hypothetical protein